MEYEKLQQLIAEIFQREPEQVKMEHSLTKDYGADTLTMFQVLLGVEAEFGLIIEKEEAMEWKNVEDIWKCIQSQ